MKLTLIFSLILLVHGNLNAQITLQMSDLPDVGNTLWQINDTSGSPAVTAPIAVGAGASWNFTTGWINVDTTQINFAPASSVDPAILVQFPGAQLVFDQVRDSTLLFFTRNSDGMSVAGTYLYGSMDVNGIMLDSIASVFVEPELIVPVPFTYNDTRNSSSFLLTNLNIDFPGIGNVVVSQKRKSIKVSECVGYGSLTTPSGIYNSCLLIKTLITVYDTLYTANPFVGPLLNNDTITHSTNYMWVTNDVNQVILMEANADSAGLQFNSASYSYKGNVSMQPKWADKSLIAYPIPASHQVTIEVPKGNHNGFMYWYAADGKCVKTSTLSNESVQTISLTDVMPGVYTNCIYIDSVMHCGKILISK